MHPIDLTEAVTAAARRARQEVVDRYAKLYPDAEVLYTFDELHITEQNDYREQVLPLIWAAHRDIARQVLRAAAAKIDADGQDVNWEEDNYGAGRRHAADELEALARELDPENIPSEAGPHEG